LRRFFLKATTFVARSCATIWAATEAPEQRRADFDPANRTRKGDGRARLAGEAFDLQHVAGRDPILLAAGADDREHRITLTAKHECRRNRWVSRKAGNIATDFSQSTHGQALASTKRGVYAAIMPALLDRLYHLHWVTQDVARCAQPYLGFYRGFLRPHGFKSLINLRGENADFRWWRTEKRIAQELGMPISV
jgi:hypothetical protein